MRIIIFFISVLFFQAISADAIILPMRERAQVIDKIIDERIETVLPGLMERTGIDMWVIISREYNEDPVLKTFLPSTWQTARRRTILLIFNPGDEKPLETLAVARYGVGETFIKAWDKELHGDQWKRLAELIDERNPNQIGINYSDTFALADGITHTEYDLFLESLKPVHRDKVISAENLSVGWLETRSKTEMIIYQQICRIAHEILAAGLTDEVIQPGITTTNDVAWWYRDRIRELKLTAWFHPSVSIQRETSPALDAKSSILARHDDNIIMPGDLLHVDFGITYLRLNTDTQQHAYVLKTGENKIPDDLKIAMQNGNRLQDILIGEIAAGRTGNEVLSSALRKAKNEGITPSIYTHPIGYHGHGAGSTIGMWDQQGGVPGGGDYPIYPNTAYSIELYAETNIPSWGKPVRIKLEEDAMFDGESVYYIDGRQKEIFLIPRQAPQQ
ncbi:MAG: Xaa-Pro aminopeptidase [Woeseiaceae bacterium]|nr:Xaa-Pro aminopeptidase [Woeseiaceae bacterium]|tara:strand:+ start:2490 stop:3827 length:1338 start_codon:yes stop_codon:yes gene_type:complete